MDEDHNNPQSQETIERDGPPVKLIALLLVVIAFATFFFQNLQDTSIDFLWMNGQWPVWTVIGVSVVAGVVIDRLFTWQWRRARRRKEAS